MPQTNNEFYEGYDKDTDNLKKKNTVLSEALNLRLVNVEGQGFVVTNVEGNEQFFSLKPYFIPLGKCEYNGVAYIFSLNLATNEGELGTYPSPDCNGNFLPVYQPLQNFSGPVNPIVIPNPTPLPFTTTRFNFDCENQVECFARIDFDNSVNIYFTDNKNPIRVINSGFTIYGFCTGRFYWNGSFPNGVELINETCGHPVAALNTITQGGALQAGNYVFFFRYNTIDFNPTSFLGESHACQISPNNSGSGWITQGAQGLTVTNKKVTLDISNLDISFPYLEVAFVYYYEGTFSTGLVDFLYNINGQPTITIDITGNETIIDFTLEEIIKRKPTCDIVKTITHMENRFWGGNVKCRDLFNQDLVDFAKCVLPEADNSFEVDDQYAQAGQSELLFGQYKDFNKTYNQDGYFRTESYALGMVFVFNSGRESEVYPTSGFDAWLDPTGAVLNDQGIFRFPHTQQLPHIINDPTNSYKFKLAIAGLKFDFIPPGCAPTQWMLDNICGFYFVRAERKPNLIKQGVMMNTYNTTCRPGNHTCLITSSEVENYNTNGRGNYIPLIHTNGGGQSPCPASGGMYPIVGIDDNGIGQNDDCFNLSVANVRSVDKYAFISPDFMLTQEHSNGQYYIQGIGKMVYNGNVSYGGDFNTGFALPSGIIDCLRFNPVAGNTGVIHGVGTFAIGPWQGTATNGFISYVSESDFSYYKKQCVLGYGEFYNRTFGNPRYIGMQGATNVFHSGAYTGALNPTFPGGVPITGNNNIEMWYTNMYRIDPINGWTNATLVSQYTVKNTEYYKISDFIPLSQYATYINSNPVRPVFYRGDCFLQRTYHKVFYNPDAYDLTDVDDCQGAFKTFGIVAAIITENNVNSAMRHNVAGSNEYYPQTGLFNGVNGPQAFVLNNKYEAEVYNEGYQKTLSIFAINGYDFSIPAGARGRRFPTRIIYSEQHVLNSLSDGYKKIGIAQFRDFDYRLGEINKIIDLNLRLISIQDQGINLHFINEKALMPSGGASPELVIGTGDVLSQKTQPLADQLGSQHQWSICKSEHYIYGIDFNKRKIWRMAPDSGVEIVSVTKRIDSELYEILEQYSHISDVTQRLPDNPVCREGLTSVYDRKFGDIIFCFTFNQTIQDPVDNFTLKFNEKINAFTGRYSLNTAMFVTINEDLYSFNSAMFPSQGVPSNAGDAWLEGRHFDTFGNSQKTTVFGVLKQMILGFIVNQYSDNAKVFDQHDIISGPTTPESIAYETQHQAATQNPFITPVAQKQLTPSYLENAWRVPITRTQIIINPVNNIYSPLSRFRGMYLKTTLTYLSNSAIFVKSVLTKFRPSKQ